MRKLRTVVPERALARPPAGAFDGTPKMCGFPTGATHGYPIGCWWDMMKGGVTTNNAKSGSTSRTGHIWCGCGTYQEYPSRIVGERSEGNRQRVRACAAATMQETAT